MFFCPCGVICPAHCVCMALDDRRRGRGPWSSSSAELVEGLLWPLLGTGMAPEDRL